MADEPQDQRRGWLINGNTPGDYMKAPRCGAKTRRGTTCQCPGMKTNGRCRVHGGLSTGPKTRNGIERIRQSRTKHGFYSQEFQAKRARGREAIRRLKGIVKGLENSTRW